MLLSPKLILWHLRQKYAVQASDPFSSEPCLKCALCHCTESVPAGGFIYIVSEIPEEFLRSPLRSMMVVTAPRSKDTLRHCPNICVIPDADPVSLLEFIEQIFQKYEEWNQALFESRMMNGSIQSLLDMTSTIIPNPMVLIGMDFTIIASRGTSLGDLPSSVLGSTEETADLILRQDDYMNP